MDYVRLSFAEDNVTGGASMIKPDGANAATETHIVLTPTRPGSLDEHLGTLQGAYSDALEQLGVSADSAVIRRLFASDLINQASAIRRSPLAQNGAVSLIEQPPLPAAKVALHAYHVSDGRDASRYRPADPRCHCFSRHGRDHILLTSLCDASEADAYAQTHAAFLQLERLLDEYTMTVEDHVLRTWIYVKNLDTDYQGVVRARREFFQQRGLTPDTHTIASTGIAGGNDSEDVHVTLDAYAVKGLSATQVHYLEALAHLSPTHVYGVTFERGAAIDYGDRRHVLLSGTASIDARGEVVHEGNVLRQLDRTLGNMEALLSNARAGLRDVTHFLVYLRDASDYALVRNALEVRFPTVPTVILHAPVCRPGWLIELEANAIVCDPTADVAPF